MQYSIPKTHLKIGHIIPFCSSDYGGPVTSLHNIIKFSDIPIDHHVIFCMKSSSCSYKISNLGCSIKFFNVLDLIILFFSTFNIYHPRTNKLHDISLIHIHGLWHPIILVFYRITIFYKIPYVVNLRGMLLPYAISQKKFKKFIAFILYQRRILNKARLLISSSTNELNDCIKYKFKSPSVFVPNPVALSNHGIKSHKSSNTFIFSFVGRLHPIKGIDIFIEALSSFKHYNYIFQIIGPDNHNYISYLKRLINKNKLNKNVHYLGEKVGLELDNIMRLCDVLVLPSHSENFGLVVAESLNKGIPVLTTNSTPWTDLVKYKCGWVVDPSVEGLRQGIRCCLNTPKDLLITMGNNGRKFISKYDAVKVSKFNTLIYKYCINSNRNIPKYIS